jgi:hypothetical protein
LKHKYSLVTNISKNLINFETLAFGENRRQKNFKILFSKIVYPKIGVGYALLFAFWPFFSFSLKTNDIYPWIMSINEQNIIWVLRRQKNKNRN